MIFIRLILTLLKGIELGEKVAESVANIVENWATNNQNPTMDSVIIVAQFSSRLHKPIYEKTAAQYQQAGKDDLIGILTNKIQTDYGSELALADDLSQVFETEK